MKCKKHPRYHVVYRPKSKCWKCKLMWAVRCVRKFFGLSVPKARRRFPYPVVLTPVNGTGPKVEVKE